MTCAGPGPEWELSMYERILLAYDGSLEGRRALREGAVLALTCKAKVYLLSVISESAGMRLAEGTLAGAVAHTQEMYRSVLDEGVERLLALGLKPVAKLVSGEPAQEIGAFAREIRADLVVVGHRQQSLFSRWWSGRTGAYLMDHIGCSLLIGRNEIGEGVVEALAARQTA